MKGIKKMLIVKKSSVITLCLISVLVVAGYLNFINTPKVPEETVRVSSEGEEESYYEEPENYGEAKFVDSSAVTESSGDNLRYERDKKKSEIISIYKELAEDNKTDESTRAEAAKAALKAAKDAESENNMEALLNQKGYEDVIALITNDGVTVSVEKDELLKNDIAVIRDVIISETGVTSDKIRIRNN